MRFCIKTEAATVFQNKIVTVPNKKWRRGMLKLNKKSFFLLAVIFVLISFMKSFGDELNIEIENNLYRCKNYKFSFRIPEGWLFKSFPNDQNRRLLFSKTIEAPNALEKLPLGAVGYTLCDDMDDTKLKDEMNKYIKSLPLEGSYKNLTVERMDTIPQSKVNAKGILEYVFVGNIDGKDRLFKTKQIYIQHNRILFAFRLTDLESKFKENEKVLDSMADSLMFE